MTLEEMRRRKRELGYSNEKLAELSGIPLGTVQKVMSGSTKSPRQGTMEALARALSSWEKTPCLYPGPMADGFARILKEPAAVYGPEKKNIYHRRYLCFAGRRQGRADRRRDLLHGVAYENASEDRRRYAPGGCRVYPVPRGRV